MFFSFANLNMIALKQFISYCPTQRVYYVDLLWSGSCRPLRGGLTSSSRGHSTDSDKQSCLPTAREDS